MRQVTARRLAAVCALTVAGGAWLLAQQPSPQQTSPAFHTDVNVVRLEVSVIDKDRRPVRGLTAADFIVREDGCERPITAFASVELPPAATRVPVASWVRDAPRDVVSNAGADEGRLVVITFDWSIRTYDQTLARKIAHAAVDGLGPTDQAAVVFIDPASNAGVPQNFTSDRALLRAAIDRTFAAALVIPPGSSIADPEGYESGGCHCRTCALAALTRVASTLRTVSQRPKVVLFIGTYVRTFEAVGGGGVTRFDRGGFKLGLALQPGVCNVPLNDARENMERAMAEANATIHVLDPAGLETAGNAVLGENRIRERLDSLPVIADLTGGRTVMNTNEPETHVASILEESGSYYLLGFAPDATAPDGRSHRVEVRVNRPDVTVKARDRYSRTEEAASTVEADAGLVRTIGGVLPASEVPFEASAVPLIVGGDAATAALVIGRISTGSRENVAAGLKPRGSTGALKPAGYDPAGITLLSAAFKPRGAEVASRRVTLRPVGEGEPGAVLGLVSRLDIEPGLHEVRIAVELPDVPDVPHVPNVPDVPSTPRVGSVNTFVDVPDFSRAPLSMSGVLVHVAPEEATTPLEELQGVLPFVPTARRTFERMEAVSAFVQISQGTSRINTLEPVTVRVRVINVQDAVVRDQTLTLVPDEFSMHRTAIPRLALPVQNLPSGEYLLRVDATMGERTADRVVRFEVR